MPWRAIRLELAHTEEYPRGSASRAYLLRLPLGEDGAIDEALLAAAPTLATVRRFWPNEPDISGYIVRDAGGWCFCYEPCKCEAAACHVDMPKMYLGQCVTLTQPDGRQLPFRVASLRDLT